MPIKPIRTFLFFCFVTFLFSVSYGKKKSEDSTKSIKSEATKVKGEAGKLKKDLKKIQQALSFKNFVHHVDSKMLANQFVHQQHKEVKGHSASPYKVDHQKLGLKVGPYKPGTQFKLDYEVLGWYPNWEGDLYKDLNYSLLTTIAYFSYELDPATGDPTTIYDWETTPLLDSAKANGSNVLLTVTNFGEANNRQFLGNQTAISTLIEQLKTLLGQAGANGICLDFEGVPKSQKKSFSTFVTLVSQELKRVNKNYQVYLAIPSVDWEQYLDFEVLVPVVDRFVIMGYGYYGSTSTIAGPVAPLNSGKSWEPYNLSMSVDYYLAHSVPSNKLILALPYYGSIWDTENGKKGAKAKSFIGNRTYDYIRSKIVAPIQYDSVSQSAWCSYVVAGDEPTYRQCWFDNDSTLSVKLNYIKSKQLKGMGIWALGYDKGYDNLWASIAQNLCNTGVKSEGGVVADSTSTTPKTGVMSILNKVESILKEVTDYKTVLLFTMSFVVFFGGIGLVIAMFQPNTRIYFFGNNAYTVYYLSFVLLFLMVILRWTNVITDNGIALFIGFVVGAVSLFIITRILQRIKRNMP